MHALVTGTSSGIGSAIAIELAKAGYDLTLVARTEGPAHAAIEALAPRSQFIGFDLAELEKIPDLVERAVEGLGEIDLLVNNAGVTLVEHVDRTDADEVDRVLKVDLLAPLALTRLIVPSMKKRGSGTIVDMASVNALAPTPYSFHYNAAKAGLAAASESLRAELRPHGIHVVTVYPGPIDTQLLARASEKLAVSVPGFALGSPDVLARRIVRAVRSRHDRIVYPRMFAITRLVPNTVRWSIDRFYPRLSPG
jgi:short-subunit dehydrogenase